MLQALDLQASQRQIEKNNFIRRSKRAGRNSWEEMKLLPSGKSRQHHWTGVMHLLLTQTWGKPKSRGLRGREKHDSSLIRPRWTGCCVSCSVMSDSFVTPWIETTSVHGKLRQEYWSGMPFLLQGIFLTQRSNLGLLHCRQILYHLSHQGSPKADNE